MVISNGHVIDKHQMFVSVLQRGCEARHEPFKLTYATRDDGNVIREMGRSLITIARQSPGGMLVFFPSYSVMNNLNKKWQVGYTLQQQAV